jgi:hypothetical protein
MLEQLGIGEGSGVTTLIRGNADGVNFGGSEGGGAKTTSTSAYVGNSSGNDIKNSTLQEAEDQKKQLMVEAKEEAEANQIDMINETVLKIYELLDDVTTGKNSFRVKVEGYGLTGAGSSSSSQAGVAALANAGGGGGSSAFSSGSDSSSNSSSVSGNASLSGWATI